MKAEIIELLGKSRSDLRVNFTDGKETMRIIDSKTFTGESAWTDFEHYYSDNKELFDSVSRLDVYTGFNDPIYITKFQNLNLLTIISRISLRFPNMENMTSLNEIHINQQSKASSFPNIWTAPNLSKLYIGDFSITKSVEISSLDEIMKCKSLKDLYLGNVTLPNGEIRKIEYIISLKVLKLPQLIPVEDLAYLSAKMANVKSDELQAYQLCETPWGNVKVNGKRRPYLSLPKDQGKLEKFVSEFQYLRSRHN